MRESKISMKAFILKVQPLLSFLVFACLFASSLAAQSAVIPAGVPLRVQVDHTYRVRAGVRIQGHLIEPVFLSDHTVLPVNTSITGTILGMEPDSKQSR